MTLLDRLRDHPRVDLDLIQRGDQFLVLQNIALTITELIQQLVLQAPQPLRKLDLPLHLLLALGLNLGPLHADKQIQTLILERAGRDHKIHKSDPAADIGREAGVLIPRGHEELEARLKVDFLVADADERAAALLEDLLVQHAADNLINRLHVLHEQRLSEAQSVLELLHKVLFAEARHEHFGELLL